MNRSELGLIEMLSIFGIGLVLVVWQLVSVWRERRRDRERAERKEREGGS